MLLHLAAAGVVGAGNKKSCMGYNVSDVHCMCNAMYLSTTFADAQCLVCAVQCVAEGFVSKALRRYFPSKRVKLNM